MSTGDSRLEIDSCCGTIFGTASTFRARTPRLVGLRLGLGDGNLLRLPRRLIHNRLKLELGAARTFVERVRFLGTALTAFARAGESGLGGAAGSSGMRRLRLFLFLDLNLPVHTQPQIYVYFAHLLPPPYSLLWYAWLRSRWILSVGISFSSPGCCSTRAAASFRSGRRTQYLRELWFRSKSIICLGRPPRPLRWGEFRRCFDRGYGGCGRACQATRRRCFILCSWSCGFSFRGHHEDSREVIGGGEEMPASQKRVETSPDVRVDVNCHKREQSHVTCAYRNLSAVAALTLPQPASAPSSLHCPVSVHHGQLDLCLGLDWHGRRPSSCLCRPSLLHCEEAVRAPLPARPDICKHGFVETRQASPVMFAPSCELNVWRNYH